MSEQETLAPWHDDRLGYRELGETFTNLVTSITDTRVISIEAGFGHGKTYFRKNWAQHLRDAGEVVIEIDAMLSDHSGEPVVTFLGAMLEQIETTDPSRFETAKAAAKKMGGVVVRAGLKAVLRSGAEEIIDFAAEQSDSVTLDEIIEGVGGKLSDVAAGLIDSQLATENARKRELPEQLGILRDLLTEEKGTERVIVIVDELDRCHPEYAIALLEAMKVVFNLDGFVFCLMVNAHALERLADHRFGKHEQGERYLDKFVDMRLRLEAKQDVKLVAVRDLILKLPKVSIPFAEGEEFLPERAAEVAQGILKVENFTMRQIERVVGRLELAIRTHNDVHIDLPLLVAVAFATEAFGPRGYENDTKHEALFDEADAQRANLTATWGQAVAREFDDEIKTTMNFLDGDSLNTLLKKSEGLKLSFLWKREVIDRYRSNLQVSQDEWFPNLHEAIQDDWFVILHGILPDYLPSHEAILNAALSISADT